jgi:hypothetical protein
MGLTEKEEDPGLFGKTRKDEYDISNRRSRSSQARMPYDERRYAARLFIL